MSQQGGPVHGERVIGAQQHTIQFNITDDNGVDSAYYTLDGTFAGELLYISANLYECSIDLGNGYGSRTLIFYSTDGSTNHNTGSTVITLTIIPR